MTALLVPILAAIWRPLAALLGMAGAYLKGRSDARAKAHTESLARDLFARDTANEISNAIAREPDPTAKLRAEWQRPEPVRPVAPNPDRGG